MKHRLLIVLICCWGQSFSQQYSLVKTWQDDVRLCSTDQGGNFYTVNTDNQLKKYNAEGILQNTYSQLGYGTIGSLDASNPLRIVLFYPLNAHLVVLDRMLAPIAEYNLRNANIFGAIAVCNAKGKGFWVYDNAQSRLLQLDQNAEQILAENANLVSTLGFKPQLSGCYASDDRILLNDTAKGLLQFDQFGTYVKTIPVTNVRALQVYGQDLFFLTKEGLVRSRTNAIKQEMLSLPEQTEVRSVCISSNRLLTVSPKSVSLWAF